MHELTIKNLDHIGVASDEGRCWEQLVASSPASGFMQSLAWRDLKRASGLRTLHLGAYQGGELLGGAICYASAQQRGAGLFVSPEGPVLPWGTPLARPLLRALLDELERQAPAYDALGLRVEPRLPAPKPRLLREFSRAPLDLLTAETLCLDLTRSEQALLAAMKPKGRYNIRLAGRHGVAVREQSSPEAVPLLYQQLFEASQRDAFYLEPLSFFVNLVEQLAPAGMLHLLFAEHEGEPLGALALLVYGGRATYIYGGVANRKRPLMAGYALQWGAIRLARSLGCHTYDFYGYEPHGDPDHLYAGFSRFKSQFGGAPERFIGAHDYFFLDRLARVVIETARALSPTEV